MASTGGFISEALLDTQSTIRALDAKLGAFLAALVLPFSLLGRAWSHISYLCSNEPIWIGVVLAALFFSLWISSIAVIALGLAAIDNPSKHVLSESQIPDVYYGGGLFKLSFIDAFLNRDSVVSNFSVEEMAQFLPRTEAEIEMQLMKEKLKTTYIRDVKLHRLRIGYRLSMCWVLVGASIFISSKLS
jgi:hypothetical protein